MHISRYEGVLFLAVAGLILGAGAFNYVQVSKNEAAAIVYKPCDFGNASTSQSFTALGDSFFGGGPIYNISCAREAYERAIALDPKGSGTAWHQKGRTEFIQGKFDAALYSFEQQIAYFGDYPANVYYMRGLTYGFKARKNSNPEDWKRAEDAFKRFIELDTLSPWARVDLAWVFFAQGKYDDMKPYLEEGLKTHPDHPWLHNMYGLALLNTGEREDAHAHFVTALEGAKRLTPEVWGESYPGNAPESWAQGLSEMIAAFEKNVALAAPTATR